MKRLAFLALGIVLLLALAYTPAEKIYAEESCTSGPVGTVFQFTFTGFSPNTPVSIYLVEPGGVATPPFGPSTAKSDASGTVTYSHASKFGNAAALALGTWKIVVEEQGPAKTIRHRGISCFTVTGGTEGVSGAALSADPATLNKPTQAYQRSSATAPGVDVTFNDRTFAFTDIHGSGFASGESVTIWVEAPNGKCNSLTSHLMDRYSNYAPPLISYNLNETLNLPIYDGLSAQIVGNVKASEGGTISFGLGFSSLACEGKWRIVGRGNSSRHGAETWLAVIGNSIEETATLEASKASVDPLFDNIFFSGSGFAGNEHVSCWLSSPDGQAIGFPDLNPVVGYIGTQSLQDTQFFASAGGTLGFEMVTGSVYQKYSENVSGTLFGSAKGNGETKIPIQSEGVLGEWAMSCRGDSSGKVGIAHFFVGAKPRIVEGKEGTSTAGEVNNGGDGGARKSDDVIIGDAPVPVFSIDP